MITEVENNPDLFDIELFEKEIGAKVNKIRSDHSVAVMDNLDPMNNFNIIEKNWQDKWEKDKFLYVNEDKEKEKKI
jgi:hypothetical protein